MTDGIDGTGGSKSDRVRLIEVAPARTQGMTTRRTNAAESIDEGEQPQQRRPSDKEFLVVIPGPSALTPWEQGAADSGSWPVRMHFPSVAAADAYSKRAAPTRDFEGLPYLLTPVEAARLLRTTVGAIYARVERGQMPGVVRQGRKILIHRDAIRRALDREANATARRSK